MPLTEFVIDNDEHWLRFLADAGFALDRFDEGPRTVVLELCRLAFAAGGMSGCDRVTKEVEALGLRLNPGA